MEYNYGIGVSYNVAILVLGCYDGYLYTLRADTGSIHWSFAAPGSRDYPIKSSPCVDPHTSWVWFGSHDHHLYAVDIYVRRLL